ncbi:transposase, partial [Sulfobacillus harzensis]
LKLKTGQKMPPRRAGAVDRVTRRVAREAQRGPRPTQPSDIWDQLLATTATASVHRGVLPAAWHLAPDGSPIDSGAYSFGAKRCGCPGKSCHCQRWFSDPMALLGWDSHRHRYFFGYMPLAMAVINAMPDQSSHPLLVSLALHPGNRNDAVAYPDLLVKTQALYAAEDPAIRITHMVGDAAFDANALWTFTRERGVVPAFAPPGPVEPAHISPAARAAGITLDDKNRPHCSADRNLIGLGQKRLGVTVYACPLRQRRHESCDSPCAKARQTVTVNDRGSRYAESGVPYGTPAWTTLYAERTGVERAFSLWTQDGIKRAHHRRPYLWLARLAMGAIVAHHQAWGRVAAA